jgi:hypothetical protein
MILEIVLLFLPKLIEKIKNKNGDKAFFEKLFSENTFNKIHTFLQVYEKAREQYTNQDKF